MQRNLRFALLSAVLLVLGLLIGPAGAHRRWNGVANGCTSLERM